MGGNCYFSSLEFVGNPSFRTLRDRSEIWSAQSREQQIALHMYKSSVCTVVFIGDSLAGSLKPPRRYKLKRFILLRKDCRLWSLYGMEA